MQGTIPISIERTRDYHKKSASPQTLDRFVCFCEPVRSHCQAPGSRALIFLTSAAVIPAARSARSVTPCPSSQSAAQSRPSGARDGDNPALRSPKVLAVLNVCRAREILAARDKSDALQVIVHRDTEMIARRHILVGQHRIAEIQRPIWAVFAPLMLSPVPEAQPPTYAQLETYRFRPESKIDTFLYPHKGGQNQRSRPTAEVRSNSESACCWGLSRRTCLVRAGH